METKLLKYIRNKKGEPRGVVVAIRKGDEVNYGYSLCHSTKDKWDRHTGIIIAEYRALSESYKLPKAENTQKIIEKAFSDLSKRAVNYFKDLPRENVEFEIVCDISSSPYGN